MAAGLADPLGSNEAASLESYSASLLDFAEESLTAVQSETLRAYLKELLSDDLMVE
jgi:hypothetical protein